MVHSSEVSRSGQPRVLLVCGSGQSRCRRSFCQCCSCRRRHDLCWCHYRGAVLAVLEVVQEAVAHFRCRFRAAVKVAGTADHSAMSRQTHSHQNCQGTCRVGQECCGNSLDESNHVRRELDLALISVFGLALISISGVFASPPQRSCSKKWQWP